MKILSDEHNRYIDIAVEIALQSTCLRSKCGSIIVKDGEVIGKGCNTPSGEYESQRRCLIKKDEYDKKVTDKTCCMHAEKRAVMDALKYYSDEMVGATLYFIRLDEENNKMYAGKPYCTICSKMALDVGIKDFVLYHEDGITSYETKEYNELSYKYNV